MNEEIMGQPYFEILAPSQWTVPAVFNSPHSGSAIPQSLLHQSRLSGSELRKSEDRYVNELFSGAQTLGAPLLQALVSRAYIDLNREPYELDARMFMEELPGYMNPGSPRVASGLGTVPKLVSESEEIYPGKIHLADAKLRIDEVYRPYHRTLSALLNECYNATGFSLLVDCHSMPASAVQTLRSMQRPAIDVVLGDRFGAACSNDIAMEAERLLIAEGLRVVRNKPYAGGFITETYGAPRHNRHALQIEINRGLYMDERSYEKKPGFVDVQNTLTRVIAELLAYLPQKQDVDHLRLAAE